MSALTELLDARATAGSEEQRSLLVPGVFNPIGARLAEREGFGCVYLSGTATAAASFGLPDAGLIGRTEMVEACGRITAATPIPVIADADTGYGGAVAQRRTVEEFARAGAAAVTIEDQVHQKHCGYTDDLALVATGEIASRISAAVEGRLDGGPTVIGRTDSLAVDGLDAAIDRAVAMYEAGAELTWILGLQRFSADELAEIRARIPGRAMVDYTELESSRSHSFSSLAAAGFDVVLVALSTVLVSLNAMQAALRSLREAGDWRAYRESLMSFDDFNRLAGLNEAHEFEQQTASSQRNADQLGYRR